jgi:hypothetical protein
MYSSRPERRYLYLYISPFDDSDLERGVNKALDAINKLLVMWKPPIRREFFRPDMWWQHAPCPYCLRRVEYENEMWRNGKYVWRRNMCLRHWFVHHLSMVAPYEPSSLISNRPVDIVADDRLIQFGVETVNYRYSVWISKERAEMEVVYKDKTYKYTFRNHLRGYPYLSSYVNILIDAHSALEVFRDFLTDYVLKRRLRNYVVINDVFKIPPVRDDATGCGVCQL